MGGACVTCMAGVCVAAGQVWRGEHVWHGGGASMAGGKCGRGHAWQILRDTVNERAVRILLECILVIQILNKYLRKYV